MTYDGKRKVYEYEGLVLAILFYSSECWCLRESELQELHRRFHQDCVRTMCRISMWHVEQYSITNQELLDRARFVFKEPMKGPPGGRPAPLSRPSSPSAPQARGEPGRGQRTRTPRSRAGRRSRRICTGDLATQCAALFVWFAAQAVLVHNRL